MNILRKTFSPFILLISISLLIYTFYKSEIYFKGDLRDYYSIYYIISIIFIILSFLTFYINKKFKDYIIISTISFFITLYLFEIFLTLKNPLDKKIKIYEKETGKKYDTRSRFQLFNEIKKKNEDIKIVVFPATHLSETKKILPLSGVSNSETIFWNENGYYSIYNSDRYGFNNPDDEWDQKDIEYLLVGDSFTHGACVNRPNDIASELRTLSNKSVLNLGYTSNGPLLEYATLREYLDVNVKKILWIYFEDNDLNELKKELKDKILYKYFNDLNFSQNLKSKQKEIDIMINTTMEDEIFKKKEFEKNLGFKNFKKEFIQIIKIYKTRNIIFNQTIIKPQPKANNDFKILLRLVNDLAIKNNSKLYFVYLPEYNRYLNDYDNSSYDSVKKIVNELKIPFIDIDQEVFKKERNPLKLFPFKLNGHYNIAGYKKVSEVIYNNSMD